MKTEQFINGLDDETMISDILREVSALEDIDDTMSERLLLVGPKKGGTKSAGRGARQHKRSKTLTLSNVVHKRMTTRPIKAKMSVKL